MSHTTTKRVISIDVDGVLARFEAGFVKVINKRFPEKNVPEDFEPKDWPYSEILKPEDFPPLWGDVIATPLFWYKLPGYQENCRALGIFLRECWRDFNVYYITSRPDTKGGTALEQTGAWLKDRKLYNESTSIIVVRDPKEKDHMLRGVGAISSIDDYGPTVVRSALIPSHTAWLLNRPWNSEYQNVAQDRTYRVANRLIDFLNWLLVPTTDSARETVILPPGVGQQAPGADSDSPAPQSQPLQKTTSTGE